MTNAKKFSAIILPHWRIEGGAGYYIRDLIATLRSAGDVQVAGPYARVYEKEPIQSDCLDKLTLQSLPTYEGIRVVAILYHILISTLKAISLLMLPRHKRFKGSFDTLILTSSVQAMAVPIARRLFPESRIAIVVQENVCLSRGLGCLTRFSLKRADIVVSITETWARHAREHGLEPVVLPNSYEPDYNSQENNRDMAIHSDLLYVGGSGRVKGFENFTAALPKLLSKSNIKIVCLGSYGASARKKLKEIAKEAGPLSELKLEGLVPDIRPYLRGTKLLLLPLGSPHFCRPAVEAGFFAKTFVIPDHVGLEDFAIDGLNCRTYKKNDIEQFVELAVALINSPAELTILGEMNMRIAQKFLKIRQDSIQSFIEMLKKDYE